MGLIHFAEDRINHEPVPVTPATPLPVEIVAGGGGGGGGAATIADGADVTQGAIADAAVTNPASSATVVAALKGILTLLAAATPAGTNAIGKLAANSGVDIGDVDVLSLPTPIRGPGNPVIDSYTSAAISASANTADQQVIAAPGANKQIWVYAIVGTADTGDGSVAFQDEDDTAKTGVMPVAQRGGFAMTAPGNFSMPLFKVATNKKLEIDTVTCGFKGLISYAIVDVS